MPSKYRVIATYRSLDNCSGTSRASFTGSMPTLASSIPQSPAAARRSNSVRRVSVSSSPIAALGRVQSSSWPPGSKVSREPLGNAKYGAPFGDRRSDQPRPAPYRRRKASVDARPLPSASSGQTEPSASSGNSSTSSPMRRASGDDATNNSSRTDRAK